MTDALDDHQGTVSIGGRTITNLRFVDDIDGLAGEEEELTSLVGRLVRLLHHLAYKLEQRRTKLITNNTNGINVDIRVNGEKLDEVDSESIWA